MVCALLKLHSSLALLPAEPDSHVQFPLCSVTMYWHVLKIRPGTLHLLRFRPSNQVTSNTFFCLSFYSFRYWISNAGVHNMGQRCLTFPRKIKICSRLIEYSIPTVFI
ncbi:hypothetical protein V8G54_030556 [Vigna mungo]|uniref:Uncharacterized protein n=1 Tax=Vigna mungo TaxID=3915 RepID=A0AAQ3MWD9_VIGMU